MHFRCSAGLQVDITISNYLQVADGLKIAPATLNRIKSAFTKKGTVKKRKEAATKALEKLNDYDDDTLSLLQVTIATKNPGADSEGSPSDDESGAENDDPSYTGQQTDMPATDMEPQPSVLPGMATEQQRNIGDGNRGRGLQPRCTPSDADVASYKAYKNIFSQLGYTLSPQNEVWAGKLKVADVHTLSQMGDVRLFVVSSPPSPEEGTNQELAGTSAAGKVISTARIWYAIAPTNLHDTLSSNMTH
jgi:hypothetical protein